jgi:hypothetical protein
MLLVRLRAPEGSYFADGDRAAGVLGVIATGFSVLLGLIVFLAFESYDQSRTGAEAEARLVTQQFETAQFLPLAVRRDLGHELVCYARFVVTEWPRLGRLLPLPLHGPVQAGVPSVDRDEPARGSRRPSVAVCDAGVQGL